MMRDLRMLLKTYGLFLVRAFMDYVWIKIIFTLLLYLDVYVCGAIKLDHATVNAICMGLGIFKAMNTVYIVEGFKVQLWSQEFGFNPEKFKEEEK